MFVSVPWQKVTGAVVELFFPRQCLSCGSEGDFLCPDCRRRLPRLPPPWCPRCGLPLPVEPCPACRTVRLEVDGICSPFRYEGSLRQAVLRLKYANFRALAPVLGGLMADYLEAHPLPVQAVMSVPLHRRRLRERGYNQAELLSAVLAARSGLPLRTGILARHRPTPAQAATQSREERWHNLAGAFVATPGARGLSVLLVDDVCTTGATLSACAHALREAGAKAIWGLTLARET